MALNDTISAINCVPVCDTMRELSEAQFYSLLIDKLLTETGIDLADITAEDLATSTDAGLCDLLDRVPFYNASPKAVKAVALYLADQLA
jgi:hypothetical protein